MNSHPESTAAEENLPEEQQQSTQSNNIMPQHSNNKYQSSTTPLYDMFSKHIEPLIDGFQQNYTRNNGNFLTKFANMFSFQLLFIAILLIYSTFSFAPPPIFIIVLAIIGIACAVYSMATRDPLGMFIYSVFNLIGLVFCTWYLRWGYSVIAMSFVLLLNQIRSIGYVIEFGREKLGKRQELIETLSTINQENV